VIALLDTAPGSIAADFGAIVTSDRVRDTIERVLRRGGFVLAAMNDNELQAYAAVVPIAGPVHELGSLEVARSRRRRGIASALVAELARRIEDRVIVAHAMHHHWEPEHARLAAYDYRAMLARLLARAGFRTYPSADHALDFDAVRIGAQLQ